MNAAAAYLENAGSTEPGFFVPENQAFGAEAPSLVKAAKCPTGHSGRVYDVIAEGGEIVRQMVEKYRVPDVQADGTHARLAFREWSKEWRLRCVSDVPPASAPPENSGDRITTRLSDRGATALGESCEFVTVKRKGYSTFLTLTLDDEARARIVSRVAKPVYEKRAAVKRGRRGRAGLLVMPSVVAGGSFTWVQFHALHGRTCEGLAGEIVGGAGVGELKKDSQGKIIVGGEASGPFCRVVFPWVSSLQKEVSRFFDGLQKMYARGWQCDGERIGPDGAPFSLVDNKKPLDVSLDYLWVAENPWACEQLEVGPGRYRNPHVHVLLRWRVPFKYFKPWAARIEKLWGQGFAHLEKLKNSEAAGYYVAKAAGYLTKANGESDQGPVRGNRYGISSKARAPGWVPVLVWSWGVLGHVIEEAREKWKAHTAPMREAREKLSSELKQTPKEKKDKRAKVAALLQGAREKIKAVPAFFGKFNCVFKTDEALDKFVNYAVRRGWSMDKRPPGRWYGEWQRQKRAREARAKFIASCLSPAEWLAALREWSFYSDDNWERVEDY